MAYAPLSLANYFIRASASAGAEHMKLQKLVYCAHGWSLVDMQSSKATSIVNERPQVWQYGPVFPSLYKVLKVFGRNPIVTPQSDNPFADPPLVTPDDAQTIKLLNWVWERYGGLTSFQLSEMTHKPDTAWFRTAQQYDFKVPQGLNIPDELVGREFKRVFAVEPG